MATGNYGTIRPADVSPEDVSIVMNYTLMTLKYFTVIPPTGNH